MMYSVLHDSRANKLLVMKEQHLIKVWDGSEETTRRQRCQHLACCCSRLYVHHARIFIHYDVLCAHVCNAMGLGLSVLRVGTDCHGNL